MSSANALGKWDASQVLTQGDLAIMMLGGRIVLHNLRWWQWRKRRAVERELKWIEAILTWIAEGKPSTPATLVLVSEGK